MRLTRPPFLIASSPLVLSFVLVGCGPAVELETDASTDGSSSAADGSTTTTVPQDDSTTVTPEVSTSTSTSSGSTSDDGEPSTSTDPIPPDMGGPGPSMCPAGSGDLQLEWNVSQPSHGRADAVAAGAGRVAWMAGEFTDSQLWVLDTDGNPLWDDSVPLFVELGEESYQDLELGPDGSVILAGSLLGDAFDGLLRFYDDAGNVLAEDVYATPEFEFWHAVARLSDGGAVAAGQGEDAMYVRRYTPGAEEEWSLAFSENGAYWASGVDVAPSGTIFVSGHSNTIPGPVLLALDPDGALLWSYFHEGSGGGPDLDLASSVAADEEGRAWMTVISDAGNHRVDRFDASGSIDLTIPLDFRPNAIETDADGAIVVAGAILGGDGLIVVERYDATGTHVARYEREGRFATGVAIDEDCHAYVVGFLNGSDGAWLDKLR